MRRMIRGLLVLAGSFLLQSAVAENSSNSIPYLSVFDNGLTDVAGPVEQARLLKELGYGGICTRPGKCTPELVAAFDAEGVDIAATYVVLKPEFTTIPKGVVRHIDSLKGRKTVIWFGIGVGETTEENALSLIHQVCDAAEKNGLNVVLYPHDNFYTDRVDKTLRLCRKANRTNLGISFNLCHFLAQNDQADVEKTLRSIGDDLKLVQLSGANMLPPGKPDWKQLIYPLGVGTFDMQRVLDVLDEMGYEGPFNLQCYQIKQPAREHLTASMKAWGKYYE